MREKLIKARKRKKLTQEKIAELLEVSRTTYTGYEMGKFAPSLDIALKIKKILKCKDDDIFLNTKVRTTHKRR